MDTRGAALFSIVVKQKGGETASGGSILPVPVLYFEFLFLFLFSVYRVRSKLGIDDTVE